MNTLMTIPYGRFKKMCASLAKTLDGKDSDNTPISYDFIVRSFFPEFHATLVQKQEEIGIQKYIEGYNEGYKDCSDGKLNKNEKKPKVKKARK